MANFSSSLLSFSFLSSIETQKRMVGHIDPVSILNVQLCPHVMCRLYQYIKLNLYQYLLILFVIMSCHFHPVSIINGSIESPYQKATASSCQVDSVSIMINALVSHVI